MHGSTVHVLYYIGFLLFSPHRWIKMYIDTHSHIYENEFQEDRQEVVQRAVEAGVGRIVLPDIDSEARPRMLGLAEMYPGIMLPAIGLHPTSVNENYRQELAEVVHYLGTRPFCGIGECGIDLYWDKTWYREQVKVFEYQLGIAEDASLPVIIHSRDAQEEIFRILKKHPYVRGILHCFAGTVEEARCAIDMGFLLGIGGVVTFKNSGLAAIVQEIGADHLVLETDSPYLAPVPFRGKRNESGYIPLIAQKIADTLKTDVKKIEEITTRNAMNLFTLHFENV